MGVVLNYLQLIGSLGPEILVVLTALAVLAVDLVAMRGEPARSRLLVCGGFGLVGLMASAAWLGMISYPTLLHAGVEARSAGMFLADPLTQWVKISLILLSAGSIVLAFESKFTQHAGEYLSIMLMATAGMMFMVSSNDLLQFFISLELTSLSLYILTGFHQGNRASSEAALKYLLFGGMSAAFTLFGFSYIYGITGETNLFQIASHFASGMEVSSSMLWIALAFTAVGFAFKIAAAPFHWWAPDTYEGAPIPSAAMIASGSKLASFFIFGRLLLVSLGHSHGAAGYHAFEQGWIPALCILAAASMVAGNLAALVQTQFKRLLAYSAIAHGGYALLGIIANSEQGISSVIFYMASYGFTILGAFAVCSVVERQTGSSRLSDFAGLSRREPLVALCMMVFMLSLAGIPPLAGFFGKFYLFSSVAAGAPNLGLIWLMILAIATSAVSLYYYLQVMKQIYVREPVSTSAAEPLTVPITTRLLIYLLAAVVILLGLLPGILLNPISESVHSFGF